MSQDVEMILEIWDLIKANSQPKERKIIAEKFLEIISGYGIDIEQNKDEFIGHCSILTNVIKEVYNDSYYEDDEYED